MRLVESYDQDNVCVLAGRTLPAQCLVEDDVGIRHLVTNTIVIPIRTWVQAHSQGAATIIGISNTEGGDEGWVHWMLAEEFIEGREEHRGPPPFFRPPPTAWKEWTRPTAPSYREMRHGAPTSTPGGEPSKPSTLQGEFVHLHAHSEFSALDGFSTVQEMVDAAVADNQPALAITDHGVCAAHPHLQTAALKAGIKPIFGIEAYLIGDRFERPSSAPKQTEFVKTLDSGDAPDEEAFKAAIEAHKAETFRIRNGYNHLILWAMNSTGLRNIWAMSTEANRTGFYYRPRMDWALLEQYHEGVIASTACMRGPVSQAILNDDEDGAIGAIAKLQGIFGDRLYLELHTTDLPEQVKVNRALVELANTFSVPLVAVVDSHYPCYSDRQAHRIWIAAQTNKDLQDEADLFAGDTDYHVMQAKEVRQNLRYLPEKALDEAMANTLAIAEQCDAKVEGKPTTPIFSKQGGVDADVDRLIRLCLGNWHKIQGKRFSEDEYEARFEREMKLLISKGFCGYFLMVADYCQWAKDHRILVGPGRGSGGGSLVAYLAGITEIDPVDAELLFERFLTAGRTALPDFDVDFPASKREELTRYITDRYGEDAVVRVGTHIRLKNKGVIRDLARVMKNDIPNLHYPDIEAISKIIEEAEAGEAGLGLKWEDLWEQHGEALEPYRQKYPEMFAFADRMVGRLKTYGKHAAGLVISAEGALTDRLPLRAVGEGDLRQMVAEYDMDVLEALGLIKFDVLTLRTLDTIQMAVDLIEERRGVVVNVYEWKEEYQDPQIWDSISDGHTLGIFQIETRAGTKLTKRFRPQNLNELADVITLVRPGPVRSGLTETYFRRRAGETVTFPDPRLEKVLAKTYGCLLYQEDIMQTCMVLGGYDENEADTVRKILGKKKVEAVQKEGEKFLRQVVERGMEQGATEALWAQMAEFAKYSFNRAHAFGYAVLGYWTAWLKFHYPIEFLTAALSTVDKDRIPEFITEARRMGYSVLPPDINESGIGFRASPMSVRYGLDGVKGVGESAAEAILAGQPYASWDDFLARKGAANMGVVKTLASVGAFDSLVPNRRMLERRLEFETSGESDRCQHRDDTAVGPGGLPCTFDWDSEPVELTKAGKEKKRKPPPKRCTKGCRNWTAPILNVEVLQPYTDAEIRDREMELLGVHLSSTPFDVIPPEILEEECVTAEEIETAPGGDYMVAAVISKVRPHQDRNGREMGFLGLNTPTGPLDVVVFKDEWRKNVRDLRLNRLCLAIVRKTDRGLNLVHFEPL